MTTVAGDGREDSDDGVAAEASFSFPGGIALHYDATGGERAVQGPVEAKYRVFCVQRLFSCGHGSTSRDHQGVSSYVPPFQGT